MPGFAAPSPSAARAPFSPSRSRSTLRPPAMLHRSFLNPLGFAALLFPVPLDAQVPSAPSSAPPFFC